MELKQLCYFMEVAEREHITEAALSLDVSQSAISRQIVNLEKELGIELFHRKGRNVKLSHAGKLFYDHMDKIRFMFAHAEQSVREFQNPDSGTVHIGFPSSIATYIMPVAISEFRKKYPDVKFRLNQGSYHELVAMVEKGEVNLALIAPLPQREKITGDILFTEDVVALVPARNPLATKEEIELSWLKEDDFVTFPEGYVLREMITEACRKAGFSPKISFEGADIETIKGMVSAGLGVSLIPEVTLAEGIPRNAVRVSLRKPAVTRDIGVIRSKERTLLPAEERFYDFLTNVFKGFSK